MNEGRSVVFVARTQCPGAVTNANRNVADRFFKLGYDIQFVSLFGEAAAADAALAKTHYVEFFAAKSELAAALELIKFLRKRRPSYVFISNHFHSCSALLLKNVMYPESKIVVRSHELTTSYLASRASFFDRSILPALMRLTYRWAHRVTAVSIPAARDLARALRWPVGNVLELPDAVFPEGFDVNGRRGSAPADGLYIVFVGRLVLEKDLITLLEAFRIARKKVAVSLKIVGDGPVRSEIESWLASSDIHGAVELMGYVADPSDIIRAASALIITSKREGLSHVVIEALAYGTPVVATKCGGPEQLLRNERVGVLVEVGDAASIASGILKAIEMEFDRAAASGIADQYTLDRVMSRWIAAINN